MWYLGSITPNFNPIKYNAAYIQKQEWMISTTGDWVHQNDKEDRLNNLQVTAKT